MEGHPTIPAAGWLAGRPRQTTYTTRRAGCHWISRWQPVEERWDESEACKTATGITLKRFSMYHEFFNQGIEEDFLCGSDAVVMPWKQSAGDTWRFRCRSEGSALDMTVRVVGFESVRVGDRSVRAVHIRYDGAVTGDDRGTQSQDAAAPELADGADVRVMVDQMGGDAAVEPMPREAHDLAPVDRLHRPLATGVDRHRLPLDRVGALGEAVAVDHREAIAGRPGRGHLPRL